jgi:hypothetical protein
MSPDSRPLHASAESCNCLIEFLMPIWGKRDGSAQLQQAQQFVVAKLKRRGRQPQNPADSPREQRLEVAPGLHVFVLEPVYLVDDDQRELRPVSHQCVAGQVVQKVGEPVFIGPIERRSKLFREMGVVTERASKGTFQIR